MSSRCTFIHVYIGNNISLDIDVETGLMSRRLSVVYICNRPSAGIASFLSSLVVLQKERELHNLICSEYTCTLTSSSVTTMWTSTILGSTVGVAPGSRYINSYITLSILSGAESILMRTFTSPSTCSVLPSFKLIADPVSSTCAFASSSI